MMPSRVAEQAKELKAVEEALLGVSGVLVKLPYDTWQVGSSLLGS